MINKINNLMRKGGKLREMPGKESNNNQRDGEVQGEAVEIQVEEDQSLINDTDHSDDSTDTDNSDSSDDSNDTDENAEFEQQPPECSSCRQPPEPPYSPHTTCQNCENDNPGNQSAVADVEVNNRVLQETGGTTQNNFYTRTQRVPK